jgi:hypothetical protein
MEPASAAQPVYRHIADASSAPIDPSTLARLTCDISFVSDDSTPPETLVAREAERLQRFVSPAVMWDIFERMRGEYASGAILPHSSIVTRRIRQARLSAGVELQNDQLQPLVNFFDHLNRVMFQHQTIAWLAGGDFRLHLYGRGWNEHATFGKFARGEIDGDAMRIAVLRASRINLAANVYGVVDARVVEGVSVGGFFLMRFCPADLMERFFPPLHAFCDQQQITSNADLAERATADVRRLMEFASRTLGVDVLDAWPDFPGELRAADEAGYARSAATIWPQYPGVCFSTRDELIGLVGRYLYDVPERQRVADEMRRQLAGRMQRQQRNVRVDRRTLRDAPAGHPPEVAA